jgi:glycosyltransferase involved in cell wall biosynthesis
MKRIAILMPWSVEKNSRIQRIAKTFNQEYIIDIYSIDNDMSNNISLLKDFENITIIKIPYENKFRFLDKIYLPFHSKSKCLLHGFKSTNVKYDIIYCQDLPSLIAGSKYKKNHNAILLYDIQDLFLETANQGFVKDSFVKKIKSFILERIYKFFIYRIEKKYIKFSDLTFSVNESIGLYINKLYNHTCYTIGNVPDVNRDVLIEKKLRRDLNLNSDVKIALYHGHLGDGRQLENIIESAYYFSDNIVLVIIGEGYLLKKLEDSSNKLNTYFINFLPYTDLFNYVADADLGLVMLEHINYSKKYASPNKIYECLTCRLPVIVSNSPELVRIIEKHDIGFLIEKINPKSIAKIINENIFNKDLLISKGQIGFDLVHNELNWNIEKEKLNSLIKSKIKDN